jgi:hypothetical protein
LRQKAFIDASDLICRQQTDFGPLLPVLADYWADYRSSAVSAIFMAKVTPKYVTPLQERLCHIAYDAKSS